MTTITRQNLADYLAVMFAALAEEAGIDVADTPGGIGYALDQAMADIGSDTANIAAAYAIGEYHTARRILTTLASRPDFDATAIQSSRRSQLYAMTRDLMEQAAQRAAATGHPLEHVAAGGIMVWSTDWIEPEIAT